MSKLIIIHILISIICFIVILIIKKEKQKAIIYFTICLTIPLFGILFIIIVGIFNKKNKKSQEVLYSYSKYIKEEQKYTDIKKVNSDKDINIVPINDALIINNNSIKRELIIDILKDDFSENTKILQDALSDDDTETVHYAAAALSDIKDNMQKELKKYSYLYENNKEDKQALNNYLLVLKRYLNSNMIEENTYNKYTIIYSDLLEKYIEVDKSKSTWFKEIIDINIKLKDYRKKKYYCRLFFENHSDKEETYFFCMKVFYNMKDYARFNMVLEELKKSNINLSKDGLDKLRFWIR